MTSAGVRRAGLVLGLLGSLLLGCEGLAPAPTVPPAGPTPGGPARATPLPSPPPRPPTPLHVGAGTLVLHGAGATAPLPLYHDWFQTYSSRVDSSVAFDYQGIGSGAGTQAILARAVAFAASDTPLTAEQQARTPDLVQIPTVAGAVVVGYNLPGLTQALVLDGAVLSAIFAGRLTHWNDPHLAALNPGLALPDTPVQVVHRTGGSGTTALFTGYLSAVSSDWRATVGAGLTVAWPVGAEAPTTGAMAAAIQATPGAIGYLELAAAVQNRLTYAWLRNAAGNVVEASLQATEAAVAGAPDMASGTALVNSTNPDAWPITGLTYLLVYRDLGRSADAQQAQALSRFLWWAMHTGQGRASDLLYARLSSSQITSVESLLAQLHYQGQPLLTIPTP